jgi:predicted neuraminidase
MAGVATSAVIAADAASGPERPADEIVPDKLVDGRLQPFLGKARFQMQPIFDGERFPNLVVAAEGTVLATWGSQRVRVRRSEAGGKTWGPEILVGHGIHGGGALVDPRRGEVLLFTHPQHPPRDGQTAPRTVFRSSDHGKTWRATEATFHKNDQGLIPSLHMMEHGTTLVRGPHAGRLIRPARVYRRSPDRYATTIFSDDGGQNWRAGKRFAELGTGEAALVELSDGRLIGTARKSFFDEGEPLRHQRLFAHSDDGGQTWRDAFYSDAIPDGPRYRGTERRGANYNGHFGMLAGFARLPVQGRDILLYSNADHDGHERIRMTVWASFDGGESWPVKRLVHDGLSAYSSLAAGRPGTPSAGWIYLQFEHGEGTQQYAGCQLARFNLAWLLAGQPTGDGRVPEELVAHQLAFLRPPPIVTDPGPRYAGGTRRFQGIPSLARSPQGRLWAIWYGGKTPGEDHNNYVLLVTSGDDGRTWSSEKLVIDPDGPGPVRAFDPQLWLDPKGQMWVFWTQAVGHDATVGGVWAITTDSPDQEDGRWSAPRRLTDGVMMCKPTVLTTGEWCLPGSTWRQTDDSARMVVSTDQGETWQVRGACNVPRDVRAFDEHILIERQDQSVWLLARTQYGIGESVSTDRGATWTELKPSPISHPSARFFVSRLRSDNLPLVKHGPIDQRTGRSHLTAYVSQDDGRTWTGGLLLDERSSVSYPDGVQADDGTIYIIYDYDRTGAKEILMARFTEQDVRQGKVSSDRSALRLLVNKAD